MWQNGVADDGEHKCEICGEVDYAVQWQMNALRHIT